MSARLRGWLEAASAFAFLTAVTGLGGAARVVGLASQKMFGILIAVQLIFLALEWGFRSLELFWGSIYTSFRVVRDTFAPMGLLALGAAVCSAVFELAPTKGKAWDLGEKATPEGFAGFLVVIGTMTLVYALLGSMGFPPAEYGRRRRVFVTAIQGRFVYYTLIAMWMSLMLKAPVLAALALVVALTADALWTTRSLARSAFNAAPLASKSNTLELLTTPLFFQLTDIHLTSKNLPCAEGGAGGNDALARLVPHLVDLNPPFGFLTGDITDHGDADEWNAAAELLAPLRAKGCRLLLVPGNHDLLPAYTANDAATVAISGGLHDQNVNWMRSARLHRFLLKAAAFDKRLQTPDGLPLRALLAREARGFRRLNTIARNAQRAIAAKPNDAAEIYSTSWELAFRVMQELTTTRLAIDEPLTQESSQHLSQYWRGYGPTWWKNLLTDPMSFRRFERKPWITWWYENSWWDYFPLQTYDFDSGSHIFVLNSVSPNVDFLGSALGNLGWAQIARLEKLIEESSAHNILILMHHAPYKWDDEKPPSWNYDDLQRWACLAAVGSTMLEFLTVLKKARTAGHEVLLFCGHRHGGSDHEARVGQWDGGRLGEGASLAETPKASTLCGWSDEFGRIDLGTLRRRP